MERRWDENGGDAVATTFGKSKRERGRENERVRERGEGARREGGWHFVRVCKTENEEDEGGKSEWLVY